MLLSRTRESFQPSYRLETKRTGFRFDKLSYPQFGHDTVAGRFAIIHYISKKKISFFQLENIS